MHPFRSLQSKFTLCFALLTIAMISAVAWWSISKQQALMEEAVIREGKALLESLAVACTNTMLYEEIGLVEEGGLLDNYITDIMRKKNLSVRYAIILDSKGTTLAHSSISELGRVYDDPITKTALQSPQTALQRPSPDIIDISTPLAISTKRWGTLRVGISTEHLGHEISAMIVRYVLYSACFVLAGIVVVALLFNIIIKPLKLLSREMDAASLGHELPSPTTSRRDEIGVLQKSFYRMMHRIREQDRAKEHTQKTLMQTEKMVAIGKLTSGVAHEINNPLGGILNCIYHFKRGGQTPEKKEEYLTLMEDGIKRIQKTVAGLLECARNPALERTPSEIGPLVANAFSLISYEAQRRRVHIRNEVNGGLPLVEIDRHQIVQVFLNVLLNGIQAMQTGGELVAQAQVSDGHLIVKVSDTGPGIPEDIMGRVFDPFFTTKEEGKSTGLGLAISQDIIQRHGGDIEIASVEGQGTSVYISLPLPRPIGESNAGGS